MDPTKQEEPEEPTLEAALSMLELTNNESSITLALAAHTDLRSALFTLAQASRTNPSVRSNLSVPETLQRLLQIISTALKNGGPDDPSTAIQALRCVGNACIDDDAARTVVIRWPHQWAHACLSHRDTEMVGTGVKVLYNLCVDYEAAQKWAYAEQLHDELISLLSDGKARKELREGEQGLALELLFWITNQRPPPPTPPSRGTDLSVATTTMDRKVPRLILHKLLRLPYLYAPALDVEDFAMLIEICLTYLRDPVVQSQVLKHRFVPYVWRMLSDNEQKILHLEKENEGSAAPTEEVKLLIPLTSSLTWCLSDIAAADSESINPTNGIVQLDEPFLHGLVELVVFLGADDERQATKLDSWRTANDLVRQGRTVRITRIPLAESRLPDGCDPTGSRSLLQDPEETGDQYEEDLVPNSPRMLVAACQFLANVLWGEHSQQGGQIWGRHDLYASLWSAIASMSDAELLHAASGLLVQLSRLSVDSREAIVRDENATPALQCLCRHATPQVKQDGIKLLRALGKDSPANRARFADLAKEALESTSTEVESTDSSITTGP